MTAADPKRTESERDYLYSLLAKNQLFHRVNMSKISDQIEQCSEQEVPAGIVLLHPNTQNSKLHLILSGEVEVRLDILSQTPHKILQAGHYFGEISLIDSGTTSAYIVTMTDCHLFIINEHLLWNMINNSHAVAKNMLYMFTQKVRHDNQTIIEKQAQLYQWENYALSDALTGCNNRRWFDISIDRIINRAITGEEPFCAIMLDVDRFKQYNDKRGHLAGDKALRSLADVSRELLRASDIVIRYGGEEFLILLPHTDPKEAASISERLRQKIATTSPGEEDGVDLPAFTVSMGISILNQSDTIHTLLDRADHALYQAKEAGRNRIVIAEQSTA
ncbi:hypothetical protein MNBD_GAMMA26-476 [hydrothermal vent metagenome]|uniref:GGDEF domain-containing protein n=1 Tax=hydrothermal vent metagenome TaxID=652676 RepID=A0A3B1ALE0_9ZZZZ